MKQSDVSKIKGELMDQTEKQDKERWNSNMEERNKTYVRAIELKAIHSRAIQ